MRGLKISVPVEVKIVSSLVLLVVLVRSSLNFNA